MEVLVLQVIGGLVGMAALAVGYYMAQFYKEKMANENVAYWVNKATEALEYLKSYEALADVVVRYVEGVWTGKLYGPEKLQKAKEAFIAMAADLNLEITIEDIDVILESALLRMKEGIAKGSQ